MFVSYQQYKILFYITYSDFWGEEFGQGVLTRYGSAGLTLPSVLKIILFFCENEDLLYKNVMYFFNTMYRRFA